MQAIHRGAHARYATHAMASSRSGMRARSAPFTSSSTSAARRRPVPPSPRPPGTRARYPARLRGRSAEGWVTDGGLTELANLVLLCSRHHHVLHQPGWHAKLRPDGELEVTDRAGTVRATSPPRAEAPW
jgi:hypothetical protein